MLRKKKEDRFEIIHREGSNMSNNSKIIKDTQTGVLYFYHSYGGYAGGLTPLIDKDGKPLIDKNDGTES